MFRCFPVPFLLLFASLVCLLSPPLASATSSLTLTPTPPLTASNCVLSPPLITRPSVSYASNTEFSTILLNSMQILTPATVTAINYYAVSTQLFYVQIYSPQLILKYSLLVSPSLGVSSVSVSWLVSSGDLLGFSFSGRSPVPHSSASEQDSHTIEQWVSTFMEGGHRIGRKMQTQPLANNRVYSMGMTLDSTCANTGYETIIASCSLFPPLVRHSMSPVSAGELILFSGAPVLIPQQIPSVQFIVAEPGIIFLQVWRRNQQGNGYELTQHTEYRAEYAGFHRVSVWWNVLPHDVFAVSYPFEQAGLIQFDTDKDQVQASLALQFITSDPNTTSVLTQASQSVHRFYSFQVDSEAHCTMSVLGSDQLKSRGSHDAAASTTVLVGSPAPNKQYIDSVTLKIDSLSTFSLQLYSSVTTLSGTQLVVLRSMSIVPTSVGVATFSVGWSMPQGSVVGIAGTASLASPVAFDTDSANSARAAVFTYLQLVSEGAVLTATPSSSFRFYNLQFNIRTYGYCSGVSSIPSHGTIGSCAFLKAGETCSFACRAGSELKGSPLTCDGNSTGELIGSQSCSPLPCSFSLSDAQAAVMGSCNSTLASFESCQVACLPGLVSDFPFQVDCSFGQITTQFTKCYTPGGCSLPSTLPVGALFGNCTQGGSLKSSESCTLDVNTGYVPFGSSLKLACFNTHLSPIPDFLLNPCYLPALSTNLTYGSCASAISSSRPSCDVSCELGFVASSSTTLTCIDGVLQGSLPSCTRIPDCHLPTTFPVGTAPGNCIQDGSLSIYYEQCTLEILDGYTLVGGSLTFSCQLGNLTATPVLIESSCTLPPLPPHVRNGSCSTSSSGLLSGSSCKVECAANYFTSDSTGFSCHFGELTGKMPACKLAVCQIPYQLPLGLTRGTCKLGGLLRADGDSYPNSCQLNIDPGFYVSSGSLTITCSTAGVVSPLPSIVESVVPDYVSGPCLDGPTNWPSVNDFSQMKYAGFPTCKPNQVVSSWKFKLCALPEENSVGETVQIACVDNVLVDSTASPSVVTGGTCVIGAANFASLWNSFGPVSCPDRSAVVGVGMIPCGSGFGAVLAIQCQPLIDQDRELKLVGNYANNHQQNYEGSCAPSAHLTSLYDLTKVAEFACPYSIFNFMSTVQVSACGPSNGWAKQNPICTLYQSNMAGFASLSVDWYGGSIQERFLGDTSSKPVCVIANVVSVQSAGTVFAFRLWAMSLGKLTLQTYRNFSGDYMVMGSFDYQVTQTGYIQIGIPYDQQWAIDPQDFIGFCYKTDMIVSASPYVVRFLFQTPDGLASQSPAMKYDCLPAKVGENIKGGNSASFSILYSIFSFAVGVRPTVPATFGFGVIARDRVDTLETGNCLLLDAPRITLKGKVKGFNLHAKSNKGQVYLQTYRQQGSDYILQGSFQVPTLYKGVSLANVSSSDSWQVEPGDILAHCYSHSSISFSWVNNQIIRGEDNYKVYNVLDRQNSPSWISYEGGYQTTVGGSVVGYRNIIDLAPHGASLARMYSLSIRVDPDTACDVLEEAAVGGNGKVQCNAAYCNLTCDPGFGTATPQQTCQQDGSWTSQGLCVEIPDPSISRSWALPDLNAYSLTLKWQAPVLPHLVELTGWELRWSLQFPFPTSGDIKLPSLIGLSNATGSVRLLPNILNYQIQADGQKQIEHIGIDAQLIMLVSGGSSLPVSLYSSLPCACNFHGALQQSDSENAVTFGAALDLSAKQDYSVSNSLLFTFTPNSLCADTYQVSIISNDNTPLNTPNYEVNTFHADSDISCSFLKSVTQAVTQVTYPMHGRELQLCLTQLPMYICGTCSLQYNSGQSDHGSIPQPQCITFTPSFLVNVKGTVWSAKSELAPQSVGIQGVNVTVTIVDPSTFQPLLVTLSDGSTGYVSASATTDFLGRYQILLHSDVLAEQLYTILIQPSKVDFDSSTGIYHPHNFTSVASDSPYLIERTSHPGYFAVSDFFDLSVIPILGQILVAPSKAFDKFQGCGVGNITITTYSDTDVTRSYPLASSQATLTDGRFVVTATMFSNIVLVPSQAGVNRTFDPPFLLVKVKQSLIQTKPFFDKSVSSFKLEVHGGNCGSHIGSIAPTLFLDSCGPSAHVLLSAFAEGLGNTYLVPALPYTVKLFDSKNPFSGLQRYDLDGAELPLEYLGGDVYDYVTSIKPFNVDVSNMPVDIPVFSFQYDATPDMTIVPPNTCFDPKVSDSDAAYYSSAPTNEVSYFSMDLTESYGFVTVDGQDRTDVCGNVTAYIEVLDGVTKQGNKLVALFTAGFECTTGDYPCAFPGVYNNRTKTTTWTYAFVAGPLQLSDFRTDDENSEHTQPAYSRKLLYRVAGSAEDFNTQFVVVTGTEATAGTMEILYPPYDALYILRDPPGGTSKASISVGSTITSSLELKHASGKSYDFYVNSFIGAKGFVDMCIGAMPGGDFGVIAQADIIVCSNLFTLSARAVIDTNHLHGFHAEKSTSTVLENSFTTTVATSSFPDLIDGAGDLYLTMQGSFSLSVSRTISTAECVASSKPSISWTLNPGATYNWVSNEDIEKRILKDLETTNKLILQSFAVESVEALSELTSQEAKEKKKIYEDNEIAIDGWKKLMSYNEQLKEDAEEWTDFFSNLRVPGTSADHASVGVSPMSTTSTGKTMPTDTVKSFDIYLSNSNYKPVVDPVPNSLTFYGAQEMKFTLESEIAQASSRTLDVSHNIEIDVGLSGELSAAVFWLGTDIGTKFSIEISHGVSKEFEQAFSNTVEVTLGDGDNLDMFQIKLYKDKVYGSPVYKTIGGASRCPHEAGTVNREHLEVILDQSYFSHLNPTQENVNIPVQFINQSPTQEDFTYNIQLFDNTNKEGIDYPYNTEVITVPYNLNKVFTLNLWRGAGTGNYATDIIMQIYAVPGVDTGSGGWCERKFVTMSIQWDEQCPGVSFAGYLKAVGSFTVNSQNILTSPSLTAEMIVTIHNPDYGPGETSWLAHYLKGDLQDIAIEFRAAPEGEVLSDSDWQNIKIKGSTQPLLETLFQDSLSADPKIHNEFISVVWDMSSLYPGNYQLRAITRCVTPAGASDTSLYSTPTPIINGLVDVIRPKLFGQPVPSLAPYYPGKLIQAKFTKDIACNSYYGKLRAEVWINPFQIAESKGNNPTVPVLAICSDNAITLALYAPVYDNLVGRLLTVSLSEVYDYSGNPLQGDSVEWSFKVGSFDALQSAVLISNLKLKYPVAQLYSLTGLSSFADLMAQLSDDISTFINAALDSALAPSPPASTSAAGLQSGSVLITSLQTSSDGFKSIIQFKINPFPTFPGSPPAVYSPSLFSSYFFAALNNQTYRNRSSVYPILSLIDYDPGTKDVVATVFPVADAAQNQQPFAVHQRNHLEQQGHHMHIDSLQYSLISIRVGLNPLAELTSTVSIYWQVASNAATLVLTQLNMQYKLVADELTDPDQRQEAMFQQLDVDLHQISLTQNVQDGKGVYTLTILSLPTVNGGFTAQFQIQVNSNTNSLLYVLDETSFIVGPPSLPVIQQIQQINADLISFSFLPSLQSGSSPAMGDNDVFYSLSLTHVSQSNSSLFITSLIPSSNLTLTRALNSLGLPVLTFSFHLSTLSLSMSWPLPTNGRSANIVLGLIATSSITSTAPQYSNITIMSLPSPISIFRTAQIGLNDFIIRFYEPVVVNSLYYQVSYECMTNNGTLVNGTIQVSSSAFDFIPTLPPQLPLLSYVLRLPDAQVGYSSVAVAVSVTTPLGASAKLLHPISNPVYCSPPQLTQVQLISPPTDFNSTMVIQLQWTPSQVVKPQGKQNLLNGFILSYSYTDGALLLSREIELFRMSLVSVDNTSFSQMFAVPFFASPVDTASTIYSFYVRSTLFNTDNPFLLVRGDGTGLHTLTSMPSLSSNHTTLVIKLRSTQSSTNSAATSRSKKRSQPLEGIAQPGAPAAPQYININILPSNSIRLVFPAVVNATGYTVVWYNVSSASIPLGSHCISSFESVDGVILSVLPSSVFVAPSLRVSSSFKFGVSSYNNAGHSARCITYLTVPATFSNVTDYQIVASQDVTMTSVKVNHTKTLGGYNVSLVGNAPFTLSLQPQDASIRSISTVFLHTLLSNVALYFTSCSSNSSSTASSVVELSSCNGYSVSLTPLQGQLNYLYVRTIAHDFTTQYTAIRIEWNGISSASFHHSTVMSVDQFAALSSVSSLPSLFDASSSSSSSDSSSSPLSATDGSAVAPSATAPFNRVMAGKKKKIQQQTHKQRLHNS